MSLIGFRNGTAFICPSLIEFVEVHEFNNEWVVAVHVRDRKTPYILYRSKNEADAKTNFEAFIRSLPDVEIIA